MNDTQSIAKYGLCLVLQPSGRLALGSRCLSRPETHRAKDFHKMGDAYGDPEQILLGGAPMYGVTIKLKWLRCSTANVRLSGSMQS